MYHILYKTTNKINGKHYVGIHRTDDLNDGYLGSGRNLRQAIKKYGVDAFEREVLKFCQSYDELIEEERKIVTTEFCMREDTYNIELGGAGGKVWTEELRQTMSLAKMGNTPWNKGKKVGSFITDEGREVLRNRMSGANNHMYGVDVASRMTEDANAERLRKISENNRKPKSQTEKYGKYASKRRWMVNSKGELKHYVNDDDPRLISGEFRKGKKWK